IRPQLKVAGGGGKIGVAGGLADFGNAGAAGQGVGAERVATLLNAESLGAVSPQHLDGHAPAMLKVPCRERLAPGIFVLAANERIGRLRSRLDPLALPSSDICESLRVPPEGHGAGPTSLGPGLGDTKVRPRAFGLDVANANSSDFRDPQAARGRQANHDQILPRVDRSPLPFEVGDHGRDFRTAQNPCLIQWPERSVHPRSLCEMAGLLP